MSDSLTFEFLHINSQTIPFSESTPRIDASNEDSIAGDRPLVNSLDENPSVNNLPNEQKTAEQRGQNQLNDASFDAISTVNEPSKQTLETAKSINPQRSWASVVQPTNCPTTQPHLPKLTNTKSSTNQPHASSSSTRESLDSQSQKAREHLDSKLQKAHESRLRNQQQRILPSQSRHEKVRQIQERVCHGRIQLSASIEERLSGACQRRDNFLQEKKSKSKVRESGGAPISSSDKKEDSAPTSALHNLPSSPLIAVPEDKMTVRERQAQLRRNSLEQTRLERLQKSAEQRKLKLRQAVEIRQLRVLQLETDREERERRVEEHRVEQEALKLELKEGIHRKLESGLRRHDEFIHRVKLKAKQVGEGHTLERGSSDFICTRSFSTKRKHFGPRHKKTFVSNFVDLGVTLTSVPDTHASPQQRDFEPPTPAPTSLERLLDALRKLPLDATINGSAASPIDHLIDAVLEDENGEVAKDDGGCEELARLVTSHLATWKSLHRLLPLLVSTLTPPLFLTSIQAWMKIVVTWHENEVERRVLERLVDLSTAKLLQHGAVEDRCGLVARDFLFFTEFFMSVVSSRLLFIATSSFSSLAISLTHLIAQFCSFDSEASASFQLNSIQWRSSVELATALLRAIEQNELDVAQDSLNSFHHSFLQFLNFIFARSSSNATIDAVASPDNNISTLTTAPVSNLLEHWWQTTAGHNFLNSFLPLSVTFITKFNHSDHQSHHVLSTSVSGDEILPSSINRPSSVAVVDGLLRVISIIASSHHNAWIFSTGNSPVLLQRLIALPLYFFYVPKHATVFLECLCRAVYDNEVNWTILRDSLDPSFLLDYAKCRADEPRDLTDDVWRQIAAWLDRKTPII